MGIKNKTARLEGPQLDQVIALSRFVASFLHAAAQSFDILTASLTELKSSRLAIKRGAAPLPHSELFKLLRQTDARLAGIIERCEVVKYELGRLQIETGSSFDLTELSIYKDLIKRALRDEHGVDFLVKLKAA